MGFLCLFGFRDRRIRVGAPTLPRMEPNRENDFEMERCARRSAISAATRVIKIPVSQETATTSLKPLCLQRCRLFGQVADRLRLLAQPPVKDRIGPGVCAGAYAFDLRPAGYRRRDRAGLGIYQAVSSYEGLEPPDHLDKHILRDTERAQVVEDHERREIIHAGHDDRPQEAGFLVFAVAPFLALEFATHLEEELKQSDRLSHIYVIGQTGVGKSPA
jgi:hypothetical protein